MVHLHVRRLGYLLLCFPLPPPGMAVLPDDIEYPVHDPGHMDRPGAGTRDQFHHHDPAGSDHYSPFKIATRVPGKTCRMDTVDHRVMHRAVHLYGRIYQAHDAEVPIQRTVVPVPEKRDDGICLELHAGPFHVDAFLNRGGVFYNFNISDYFQRKGDKQLISS